MKKDSESVARKPRKFIKKLTKRKPGEWVQPRMKNYFLQCCDCGLIHRLNFRVVIGKDGIAKPQFQAFRAKRAWL